MSTGELFLTFKLLKRRYRSSDNDDRLRELEYFNQPYAPGSTIKLLDDIDLDESLSLTSLASQFVAADVIETEKRGKKNATERSEKKEDKKDDEILGFALEFEPFDFGKNSY